MIFHNATVFINAALAIIRDFFQKH